MFCEYCGKKLLDNAKFCTGCGNRVKVVQSIAQQETQRQESQGQQEPQRQELQGQQEPQKQDAQSENGGEKKGKAPIIVLSALLAVLIIAIVAILVIFLVKSRTAEDVAVTNADRIEKVSNQDTSDEVGETKSEVSFASTESTENGDAQPAEESDTEKEDFFASTESTEFPVKHTDYNDLFQGGGLGYIFPDSDTRKLTEEEIEATLAESDDPLWDIQIAINELYARHGRIFNTPEIREYFESKDWYEGTIEAEYFDVNQNDYLNDVEIYNRDLLSAYRADLQ